MPLPTTVPWKKKQQNKTCIFKSNKPTNWAMQNATPLNFTISADTQSNSVSLLVILRQTVTELCNSMPAAPISQ